MPYKDAGLKQVDINNKAYHLLPVGTAHIGTYLLASVFSQDLC